MFNSTNPDGVALAGLTRLDADGTSWRRSQHSNPQDGWSELAKLPNGNIAMRNCEGGAVELTKAGLRALIQGVKEGEFDYLIA